MPAGKGHSTACWKPRSRRWKRWARAEPRRRLFLVPPSRRRATKSAPNSRSDSWPHRKATRTSFRPRRGADISCSICQASSQCVYGARGSAHSRIWRAIPMPSPRSSIPTAAACIAMSQITAARSLPSRSFDFSSRRFLDEQPCRLRLRRRPLPCRIGWDLFAFHDEGERSQARIIKNMRVVKHGGARADGDAIADEDRANLHDPVLVEMRLQGAKCVQSGIIADAHAVEFGDIGHVHIDPAPEFCPEQAHDPRQERSATQMIEQNLAGQAPIDDG